MVGLLKSLGTNVNIDEMDCHVDESHSYHIKNVLLDKEIKVEYYVRPRTSESFYLSMIILVPFHQVIHYQLSFCFINTSA